MEAARRATPADVDVLAALVTAEHDELAQQRGGALWVAHAAAASPERLLAALADARALVLAGTIDGVVLGVATARVVHASGVGAVAMIDDFFVDADAREVGIGAALIAEVVTWSRDLGCVGVDATVLPGNRAAKNFFEAHGLVARAITVHRRVDASPLS